MEVVPVDGPDSRLPRIVPGTPFWEVGLGNDKIATILHSKDTASFNPCRKHPVGRTTVGGMRMETIIVHCVKKKASEMVEINHFRCFINSVL